jgi:hypothetical protein
MTAAAVVLVILGADPARLGAQTSGEPFAALLPANAVAFPNETDSNSPAVWEVVNGSWTMSLFNSVAGWAEISAAEPARARQPGDVRFEGARTAARGSGGAHPRRRLVAWLLSQRAGRHRVSGVGQSLAAHRRRAIGRPRRHVDRPRPDHRDPAERVGCTTNNHYFVGGRGDFSVMLGLAATTPTSTTRA